ncbi:hypothetical protein [Variovorax sp. RA8]|uniref:hypothetical protein n=1 Tax=Variovorax sp. (strain JCM 16519 / RA8) TaxID=662548 RepID=UPI000AC5AB99|nr:hypothetical protein [Variovorax sp. RA8]VTU23002.1 hypothetical protein RA8CHR_02646 [Variovorax sp. RA8]
MPSLAMKVALLFKAIAMLLLLGLSMAAASQWMVGFILPWEFLVYYGIGVIVVAMIVALGAFLNLLMAKLVNKAD